MKKHHYTIQLQWTGNLGKGTEKYDSYSRDHEIAAHRKPIILGSSDPAFRGDTNRYNPEELLVSTLSSCHMLWYLHLCSVNQITVIRYEDNPTGVMIELKDGSGRFEKVTLQPVVVIKEKANKHLAENLHEEAHRNCFIANSVNFPVNCQPTLKIE